MINKTETIISFTIITFLLGLLIILLLTQSTYNLSIYGFSTSKTMPVAKPAKKINTSGITPPGFKIFSKENKYDKVSLFEKIDGKAPLYLDAGFIKLITRRYVSTIDNNLWFEVYFYDMGSLKNAFSVYSRQRRNNAQYSKDLYTYFTENSAIFIRNNYYIEILGADVNKNLTKAVLQSSRMIKKQLGPIKAIAEALLLKNSIQKKNSTQYSKINTFGIKGLEEVFTTKYKLDGETTTIFICGPMNNSKINTLQNLYSDFYKKEGAKEISTSLSLKDTVLLNYDGSYEVLFKAGKFLCGVHEGDSQKLAEKLAQKLYNTLKENGGL